MGEQWINPIGHNEKLSETLIQTLIETAVKQLRFSNTIPNRCRSSYACISTLAYLQILPIPTPPKSYLLSSRIRFLIASTAT